MFKNLRIRAAAALLNTTAGRARRRPDKGDALRALIDRGVPVGAVIDVGVQSGTAALIDALPDRPHLLVEPVEEWNPNIRTTYDAHGVAYEIVNKAASDRDGSAMLEIRAVLDTEHPSHAFMLRDGETGSDSSRSVEAVKLDTLIAARDLPEPFLLKIDVDGPDMQVVAGAEETLKRTSVLVIEAGTGDLIARGAALRAQGFELFDIVDLCYYGSRLAQVDMVFLRDDIARDHRLDFRRERFARDLWTELRA